MHYYTTLLRAVKLYNSTQQNGSAPTWNNSISFSMIYHMHYYTTLLCAVKWYNSTQQNGSALHGITLYHFQ